MSSALLTITIAELGPLGDGIGWYEGKKIYVPLTLPGDVVQVTVSSQTTKQPLKASVKNFIAHSPQRQSSACPHFMKCGGCQFQHLPPSTERDLKEKRLHETLQRAGWTKVPPIDFQSIGAGTRRRAEFRVFSQGSRVALGFYERHSHTVVPITYCAVLEPALMRLLDPLSHCLTKMVSVQHIQAITLQYNEGLIDIIITATSCAPTQNRDTLNAFAEENDIARIAWENSGSMTTLVERKPFLLDCPPLILTLPPKSFLQATAPTYTYIINILQSFFPQGCTIADLYSGVGSYGIFLASLGANVTCYEGSVEMTHSLHQALTTSTSHGLSLQAKTRDLWKHPLTTQELHTYEGVVINPPRNGAERQIEMIARAGIPYVAIISCHLLTLERDLKHLYQAGYELVTATLIDQFTWSLHCEAVILLRK